MLVVDDDDTIRMTLTAIFMGQSDKNGGKAVSVATATNGNAALERIREGETFARARPCTPQVDP